MTVTPIFELIKSKIQTWSRLPLGVMGRINIIKMMLLPKILDMVWHAPLYIPLKIFKQMEAILNSFVWGNGRHKFAWHVLKNPTDMGGASLPDLQDYYLAVQLSHIYHFNATELQCYRSLVCNKPGHLTFTPLQAIFRGNKQPKNPQDTTWACYFIIRGYGKLL